MTVQCRWTVDSKWVEIRIEAEEYRIYSSSSFSEKGELRFTSPRLDDAHTEALKIRNQLLRA